MGRDDRKRKNFIALGKRFKREKVMDRKSIFNQRIEEHYPDLFFFLGNSEELKCLKTMLRFYYYNNLKSRSPNFTKLMNKRLADTKYRIKRQISQLKGEVSLGYCYYSILWGDDDLVSASEDVLFTMPTYVPSRINALYFDKDIITGVAKTIEKVNLKLATQRLTDLS